MTDRQDLVIEEALVRLFPGSFNYRRFVRDRTREFLREAFRDGLYGLGEAGGEGSASRVAALTHGFCAGYVTGVDEKYDESCTDVDVADELLDAMAFAQSGLGDVPVPRFVLPCAYDMLVMSGDARGSVEDAGALVGAYALGLVAGIDDVSSGRLDGLFGEDGPYRAEQDLASEAIGAAVGVVRASLDVPGDGHDRLLQPRAFCRVVGDVCAGVDGDALLRSAVGLACDVTEALMRRTYVNRSGYELRNLYNEIGVRCVSMACVMTDESLKLLVGASGFDPEAAGRRLESDMRNRVAFLARFEARRVGMYDCWPQVAAYCESALACEDVVMRAKAGHMDPFRLAVTEALGATLAQIHVSDLDVTLDEEEVAEVLRAVVG